MDRQLAINKAITLIKTQGLTANVASETVGKEHGVTGRTVKRWAQQAGTPLGELSQDTAKKAREVSQAEYEARRASLSVEMLKTAEALLGRIDQKHYDYKGTPLQQVWFDVAPSGDTKNYVTSVAILIDKMRLEEGKATDRTEVYSIDAIDAEIERLVERFSANG